MSKPNVPQPGRFWTTVTDEQLIDLNLEIDDPEALPGLIKEVPDNYREAHVEFKYDLRGTEMVEEFACVHGHHRHKAGFVMNVDGKRFMVGWQCAETIYNERFDQYEADFQAAVGRQDALRRVKVVRDAFTAFAAWVQEVSASDCLRSFGKLRGFLYHQMPWVYDHLPALAALDERVTKTKMPKYLCADVSDVRDDWIRLAAETSTVTSLLAGEPQKAAATIGATRAKADGLARSAENILFKLGDIDLFFQPECLAVICEHANQHDNPKRRKYQAALLSLQIRGIDKVTIEMPKDFRMPSRQPIEALRAALASSV